MSEVLYIETPALDEYGQRIAVCSECRSRFGSPHGVGCGSQSGGLRKREGDQPLPTDGQQNVSEAVKADLDERIALGINRHGKPLQTFNGRDALLDAYQEALDLVHYLKQELLEREARHAGDRNG